MRAEPAATGAFCEGPAPGTQFVSVVIVLSRRTAGLTVSIALPRAAKGHIDADAGTRARFSGQGEPRLLDDGTRTPSCQEINSVGVQAWAPAPGWFHPPSSAVRADRSKRSSQPWAGCVSDEGLLVELAGHSQKRLPLLCSALDPVS
jgi:hypothetical protein